MTNDELAWKIIKDMHISGPWQEHVVHKAIITAINSVGTSGPKWADIKDSQPEDGERVITWNNKFNEARIQVFKPFDSSQIAHTAKPMAHSVGACILK